VLHPLAEQRARRARLSGTLREPILCRDYRARMRLAQRVDESNPRGRMWPTRAAGVAQPPRAPEGVGAPAVLTCASPVPRERVDQQNGFDPLFGLPGQKGQGDGSDWLHRELCCART